MNRLIILFLSSVSLVNLCTNQIYFAVFLCMHVEGRKKKITTDWHDSKCLHLILTLTIYIILYALQYPFVLREKNRNTSSTHMHASDINLMIASINDWWSSLDYSFFLSVSVYINASMYQVSSRIPSGNVFLLSIIIICMKLKSCLYNGHRRF